jgi:two-component system CheB/CheR fusion protein
MKSKRRSSSSARGLAKKVKPGKNNNKKQNKNGPLIVGVGASAGGLQAFTELLEHLKRDAGLSLVLLQHLAPEHESALSELLGRATEMPVTEAAEGVRMQHNHVYVIPPDCDMEVRRGALHLVPRAGKRPHMAIDHFFTSLAEDQGNRAIGVIFSGTASDGTLGLKAIKASGGITFAQDPVDAAHGEMPRNAIEAGCVDSVLPIKEIAKELMRLAQDPYLQMPPQEEGLEDGPKGEGELRKVHQTLRTVTGVDFTHYKPSTIRRRIRRRMTLLKVATLKRYTQLLTENRSEVEALFRDVLIHVTSFFRDPEAFDALKTTVFPSLVKERPAETPIRIWVAGCSTGEEVYSLAISLLEFLSDAYSAQNIQIFATDVNEDSLQKARQGEYPEGIAADVSQERLRRFFVKVPHGFRLNKAVRDACVFARHDIAKDPPFSHLDLITCRNLLIYLGPVLQKRVLPVFHYALNPSGYLLLGSSETIGSYAEYFTLLDKKHKIYTAKPGSRPSLIDFGGRPYFNAGPSRAQGQADVGPGFDLQKEADHILLNRFTPPGVIMNEDFQILHFRGKTGRYLEPPPGQATLNLAKMAREGLAVDLRAAVQEAKKHGHPVRRSGVRIKRNEQTVDVNLDVVPIKPSGAAAPYFLVLFEDASPDAPLSRKDAGSHLQTGALPTARREVARLRDELAENKNTLLSTVEDLEASNEEVRSANEEILSSNEELQSTNEELETAKEELQSANEELTTLNEELQNRNNELSSVNNDLVNLLATVNIPIVMVGHDLRIRRFTPSTENLLNLIPSDKGRPLSNIKLNFELPGFEQMVANSIDEVSAREMDIQDHKGHWYSMRISPYKTMENKIEGAVISWVEITGIKEALDETTRRYRFLFEKNLAGIFYARDGRILDCNDTFAHILGYSSREEALQEKNLDLHLTPGEQDDIYKRLEKEKNFDNEQIAIKRKDGSQAWVITSASLVEDGAAAGIAIDVTRRVQAEQELSKLTKYLMKDADDRRRELARELHDQIGSRLAGLAATVAALRRAKGMGEKISKGLEECQEIVRDCSTEVRTVSYLQHPLVIEEMGLAAAVEWYAEEFSRRSGIKVSAKVTDTLERLGTEAEIALYRIVQECLTNVQQHSGAKKAQVSITVNEGRLETEVQDFGKGFALGQEGMGIIGMRERMKEFGGRLEIESGKKGTTVKATMPLPRPKA